MQNGNGLAQDKIGSEDSEYLGFRFFSNVAIDSLSSFPRVSI